MKVKIAIDWDSHVVCSLEEALSTIKITPFEEWLDKCYKPSSVWNFDEEKREYVLREYEKYIEDEKKYNLHIHYDVRLIDI